MPPRLCLFTGSFNPPGRHHAETIARLRPLFDEVRVLPSGFRPDKPSNNAIPPTLRAALVDLAFGDLPGVVVDHSDLQNNFFSFADELNERFSASYDVWHAVSAEQVRGGGRGEAAIQRQWVRGREAWQRLQFVIFHTPDRPLDPADLPPRRQLVETNYLGSSLEIRRRLFEGHACEGDLDPRVKTFIDRYGLYRLSAVQHEGRINTERARLLIVADPRTEKARQFQQELSALGVDHNPDLILVIGGDGTMLSAIHQHWRLRRPFVGLNAGHLGFLMNEGGDLLGAARRLCHDLVVRRLPMLDVRFQRENDEPVEGLSFNDAWIERSSGQTAWLEVHENGELKLPKVVCDGVLVSTAAGSTAYAMSMGASPLLADTPAWMIVGSNVMRPRGWKSALLPMDAAIRVAGLDTGKRPLNGFMFGRLTPGVVAMSAQISRVATVELAFSPVHDMARKISDLQFGTMPEV